MVFAAIILAGIIVNVLVNLTGVPSVKFGVLYAVVARSSMGVMGAKFPAAIRGLDGIERFLNFAGPAVYVVMVAMLVYLWSQAGSDLFNAVGTMFARSDKSGFAVVSAFFGVVGTMIAYFSAVIINFGDFARFSKDEKSMKFGNFLGLPVSLTFFTFLALFITAGSYVVLQGGEGTPSTSPAAMVAETENTLLTVIAAITFLFATVGINLVANFIPPAYDLTNLAPPADQLQGRRLHHRCARLRRRCTVERRHRGGGLREVRGHPRSGARPAVRRAGRRLLHPAAAVFSMAAVWVPALQDIAGFSWVIGALLGGALYLALMARSRHRNLVDAQTKV